MSESCTVLIAAADLLPTLKLRAAETGGELLAFSDTEALRALDAISRRRPGVVALEQAFAATPRGAALINRIKADPTLGGSEIRVVAVVAWASFEIPPKIGPRYRAGINFLEADASAIEAFRTRHQV